ncbi:MAG: ATP-dependent DNA ligase [Actinomycetia bacterium]|nr:ATP-dependent DNA ligase [Actinomycetes bacterium]MCP3910326.1 ATP-dependent DNA ligase [Actinomycetes bacterium]MCP4083938.1 ATP-dependent DNA ligase [Actinomycetes bacterium]
MAGDHTTLSVEGHDVRVSNPDKVFFPKRGETKIDTIEHYLRLGDPLMGTMGGRPSLLQRFPDGANGKSFFQKRVPKGAPDWLETTTVSTPNGTTSNALVIADLAHVVWAVNMGCLGFHPWPYQAATPEVTDELRIDLDPQPRVGFDQVRQTARLVKDLFDELDMRAFVKTSGSKGLHIYVRLEPRWDSYQVRAAAVALARELERRHPHLITAAWWKEERGARVFVDFNQNAPHKTVFGAWSVRARVGGQVSTPFAWDELDDVAPEELTIATVSDRVDSQGDPWLTMNDNPQSIETLLRWFQRDLDDGLMDAPWPPVYPKQPNEPPRVAPSRARVSND